MERTLPVRRNTSIDFSKGIAITDVVMGHTFAFPCTSPFFNALFRQFKRFKHEVVRP